MLSKVSFALATLVTLVAFCYANAKIIQDKPQPPNLPDSFGSTATCSKTSLSSADWEYVVSVLSDAGNQSLVTAWEVVNDTNGNWGGIFYDFAQGVEYNVTAYNTNVTCSTQKLTTSWESPWSFLYGIEGTPTLEGPCEYPGEAGYYKWNYLKPYNTTICVTADGTFPLYFQVNIWPFMCEFSGFQPDIPNNITPPPQCT